MIKIFQICCAMREYSFYNMYKYRKIPIANIIYSAF